MQNPSLEKVILKLTEIWEKILDIKIEDTNDNFFALGGNSMQAFEIVASINKEFNVEFKMQDFFATLSIEKLAKKISK